MLNNLIQKCTSGIKREKYQDEDTLENNLLDTSVKQIRVKTIEEYLTAIDFAFKVLCDPSKGSSTLWYRGQAQQSFDLLPTITREKMGLKLNPLFETVFLSKFKSLATPYVERLPGFPFPDGITSYWSWLFMLRHYELPA
jgi:hypothetical protein